MRHVQNRHHQAAGLLVPGHQRAVGFIQLQAVEVHLAQQIDVGMARAEIGQPQADAMLVMQGVEVGDAALGQVLRLADLKLHLLGLEARLFEHGHHVVHKAFTVGVEGQQVHRKRHIGVRLLGQVAGRAHGVFQEPARKQKRQRLVPLDELHHRPGGHHIPVGHMHLFDEYLIGVAGILAKRPFRLPVKFQSIVENQVSDHVVVHARSSLPMRFSAIAALLFRPWHKNADILNCIRRRAGVFLPAGCGLRRFALFRRACYNTVASRRARGFPLFDLPRRTNE